MNKCAIVCLFIHWKMETYQLELLNYIAENEAFHFMIASGILQKLKFK